MNAKEIFKLREEIKKGKEIIEDYSRRVCFEEHEIMSLCDHEIVFCYHDNHSRRLPIETYYCPACGKIIQASSIDLLQESAFKYSRMIHLSNLSLISDEDTLSTIRKEVMNHYSLYYNPEVQEEELSARMENLLKDKQVDYNIPKQLLKRRPIC